MIENRQVWDQNQGHVGAQNRNNMRKRSLPDKIKRLTKAVYLKLFRINDSPLKISLGFGLGVFTGVMPGIGPVVALFLAFLFRVNRASALLGSILFNTWAGLIALLSAAKIGSAVMGLNYGDVYDGWNGLIKNFKWEKLFEASVYDVLISIGIGYLIISLMFAAVAAVIVHMIAQRIKTKKIKM
jgi:uncharacterized protein (DUF2062 family)